MTTTCMEPPPPRMLGLSDIRSELARLEVRRDRAKAFTFSWRLGFTDYRVERGIALPPPRTGRWQNPNFTQTLRAMEVGDSLFMPRIIRFGAKAYRLPPSDFTSRVCTEYGIRGLRIWRVAKTSEQQLKEAK